jgi:hypothetical protein
MNGAEGGNVLSPRRAVDVRDGTMQSPGEMTGRSTGSVGSRLASRLARQGHHDYVEAKWKYVCFSTFGFAWLDNGLATVDLDYGVGNAFPFGCWGAKRA